MAFHPYPQVIPALCNGHGFGPPRACSARFTLPMGSSPGFGSVRRDWPPFRTRFPSGSGCRCLSLATPNYSSAHSTKGTPSPLGNPRGSDRLEAHGFRISFTPLVGVLFTIPSRYWFTIGRWSYLALGGGPPSFPPHITCGAVLTVPEHWRSAAVDYGTLTLCGVPFQHPSSDADLAQRASCERLPLDRSTPDRQRSHARYADPVWALPRSLAATEGILSFPRGTEMFQFPRFPPPKGYPAITPGGLPHSEISGSPAASASPEHFVAWPRPSSASSAKASTVCPSFRSHLRSPRCSPPSSPRSPPGHRAEPGQGLPSPGRGACSRLRAGPAEDGRLFSLVTRPVGPGRADFHRPSSVVKVHPQVEPRGLEPRTSAVQGRRSPG